MMTYRLIESCDREFDEPDRVYSGCCPNGNPFERSKNVLDQGKRNFGNSLYSFDRSGEPHSTSTNSSSPWFPRLNKCVRR